jgi:hypothetical protein
MFDWGHINFKAKLGWLNWLTHILNSVAAAGVLAWIVSAPARCCSSTSSWHAAILMLLHMTDASHSIYARHSCTQQEAVAIVVVYTTVQQEQQGADSGLASSSVPVQFSLSSRQEPIAAAAAAASSKIRVVVCSCSITAVC